MLKPDTTAKLRRAGTEFLVIVTGVLTALALDGWNSTRQERELEETYLRSLAADLRSQVNRFDGWIRGFERRAAVAEQVWVAVTTTRPITVSAPDLRDALLSGGTYHPPRLYSDATYQDLISTGNLRLIRDQELRTAILNYHALRDQYVEWIDLLAEASSEQWNQASEGLVPATVILSSNQVEGVDRADLEPVIAAYRKREAIHASLATTIRRYDDVRDFTRIARDSAQSLITRIDSTLKR